MPEKDWITIETAVVEYFATAERIEAKLSEKKIESKIVIVEGRKVRLLAREDISDQFDARDPLVELKGVALKAAREIGAAAAGTLIGGSILYELTSDDQKLRAPENNFIARLILPGIMESPRQVEALRALNRSCSFEVEYGENLRWTPSTISRYLNFGLPEMRMFGIILNSKDGFGFLQNAGYQQDRRKLHEQALQWLNNPYHPRERRHNMLATYAEWATIGELGRHFDVPPIVLDAV